MKLPPELLKAGKTVKDFEEKRKAFERAGKSSDEEEICNELYEDLIEECKDYQELEEAFRSLARFLDQHGKESFEEQQKTLQARLLGFENEGATKVRISSSGCCESCREFDGKVLKLEQALLNLPMPSSQCSASGVSEFIWSSATYEITEESASVSKNPPSGAEFIPDPPRLEKESSVEGSKSEIPGTNKGLQDYFLPLFLILCGIIFLPFSWISGVFLILWSLPFIPLLWRNLERKLPDLSGGWIRYGTGLLGIPLALLILLLPMLLDQRSIKKNEVALPSYEVLSYQDQSIPGRSRLQVHIYAPNAVSARERARVAMQAAKQIQQTQLSENPNQPDYQYISVTLEAVRQKSGVSHPLAKAEYAPDGLGRNGDINPSKKNRWSWNVSSSSVPVESSNPDSYTGIEKSLEPFLKR